MKTKPLLAFAIVRTGPRAHVGAQAAHETVCRTLHIEPDALSAIVATGYGRNNIPFATRTEPHLPRARARVNPAVRTIIDIGGQDSKVINLDKPKPCPGFMMNDKCAAGTGRFLEMMARTLELDMEEMSRRGLTWEKGADHFQHVHGVRRIGGDFADRRQPHRTAISSTG